MARDFYASPFGAAYSAYMERPGLSRRISRLVWGGDTAPYYEGRAAIAAAPPEATIVDCPCGAGPAFRALDPRRPGRYVGVDLSPAMLKRAARSAHRRGLRNVELVLASATELPLAAGETDLYLSFWGLHCFEDPAAAVGEAARVLRPGGRLVGASFRRGREYLRQRLLMRPHRGDFGPMGSQDEILGWLSDADFELRSAQRSGPFLFFDATLRQRPTPGR
jgi:SAM-dependent methyltransferase